jgi:hypothetical protein
LLAVALAARTAGHGFQIEQPNGVIDSLCRKTVAIVSALTSLPSTMPIQICGATWAASSILTAAQKLHGNP